MRFRKLLDQILPLAFNYRELPIGNGAAALPGGARHIYIKDLVWPGFYPHFLGQLAPRTRSGRISDGQIIDATVQLYPVLAPIKTLLRVKQGSRVPNQAAIIVKPNPQDYWGELCVTFAGEHERDEEDEVPQGGRCSRVLNISLMKLESRLHVQGAVNRENVIAALYRANSNLPHDLQKVLKLKSNGPKTGTLTVPAYDHNFVGNVVVSW